MSLSSRRSRRSKRHRSQPSERAKSDCGAKLSPCEDPCICCIGLRSWSVVSGTSGALGSCAKTNAKRQDSANLPSREQALHPRQGGKQRPDRPTRRLADVPQSGLLHLVYDASLLLATSIHQLAGPCRPGPSRGSLRCRAG